MSLPGLFLDNNRGFRHKGRVVLGVREFPILNPNLAVLRFARLHPILFGNQIVVCDADDLIPAGEVLLPLCRCQAGGEGWSLRRFPRPRCRHESWCAMSRVDKSCDLEFQYVGESRRPRAACWDRGTAIGLSPSWLGADDVEAPQPPPNKGGARLFTLEMLRERDQLANLTVVP